MALRIITILAFCFFGFVIANVGAMTPTGIFIKNIIGSIPFFDKAIHLFLLASLSLLLNASLKQRRVNLCGLEVLLGSILVALGITLEEISQAFIPSRNFEWLDMVCNYTGIYAGGALLYFFDWKNTKHGANHSGKAVLLQAVQHPPG